MSLLELKKVSLSFGGLQAVSGVNITVDKGEVLGLIGPNGAGKTSIFNLISGFYRPSAGEILFQGKSIVGMRPSQVAACGIARTFQNIRLWNNMTVKENLCVSQQPRLGYGLFDLLLFTKRFRENEKKVQKAADAMLETLDLKEYAGELPKNLAYGIQRKVEIGRALVMQPTMLLLDEPAAGLNPSEVDKLISLIKWMKDQFKLTIWLIEHQMKLVMSACERIAVLDFGQLILSGLPSEIVEHPE
ncbi:MAG: ABC transporter ATP-binding protein, partial [Pseudomonadota bacterium]